jgi:PAS domain S-box-containing protein
MDHNNPALILYLEGKPRDAERVRDVLHQSALACELRVVDGRAAYQAALAQTRFDLILSTDALPDCDGLAALALARDQQPEVPFILLSGALDEEQAVDCMLRGATDFVLKQRPNRLVPAVLRALTEAALRQSEERLRQVQTLADIGAWEWNLLTGEQHWAEEIYRIFGLPRETVPSLEVFLEAVHPADRESAKEAISEALDGNPHDLDLRIRHHDGTERVIHANGEVKRDAAGKPVRFFSTIQDITERHQVETALRDSLRDKDVLLQEIHHRVKNNLQIVSSLLHLQSDQETHPTVQAVFKEAQRRVLSMALIHESLYRSQNLARVNLAEYIETLCAHVFRSFGADGTRIKLVTSLEPVVLGLEQAVPCGLILNELLSNAMKYAFPEGLAGQITLTLRAHSDQVFLQIADNGIGLPPAIPNAPARPPGLGLVAMLTKQLKGELVAERGEGTALQLAFPLHHK